MLEVPKSSYYKQAKECRPSKRELESQNFHQDVMQVYMDNQKRYGAPKIREVLKQTYPRLSVKRVQRHMKALGIRSIVYKKYRPHNQKKLFMSTGKTY